MPSVSIVIPEYNNYPLTHGLLFDIYKNCKSVNEVVIVDDCSTDEEVHSGLGWWKTSGMLPIRLLQNEKNLGFLLTANHGLRKATGDVKILISNDVKIFGDIIQAVLLALKDTSKALIGGTLYRHNTGWNTFEGQTYPYLDGCLLATTAEGWEELNYFDESFAPYDFEDVEISTNAVSKGFQLVPLPDGMMQHLGAQTNHYGPEREAQTRKNQEKFRLKWTKTLQET